MDTCPRRFALTVTLVASLFAAPVALAEPTVAPQPKPDITKMDYTPVGFFKPGDLIPEPSAPPPADAKELYNPSGKWVAYDTNVFETLNLPSRQAGDKTADDPPGNGGMPHGFCPPDPLFPVWGKCANHQLEYLDHFERTMKAILGDFGVVIKRYEFHSPGSGVRGAALSTAGGDAFNISATVPGADNPEESILVSGHFDLTDSAPAAAWDSSEGHTEVIRIAKIMADYWRATGTRPSATVKFIPWDQEESGTLGSAHYVANNVPPGQEDEIRGYFNMDPCAGAYPAYYHGSGDESSRVPMVMQLSPPEQPVEEDAAQITAFNKRAETIVDEVFDHLDDTIDTAGGKRDLFVTPGEAEAEGKASDRHMIVTAVGGLRAFTSDYANFQGIGVPIFNLFPDLFGPHADGTPASAEGVSILHTPRDNLTTINALTSPDQSGRTASEGWMKGMELCAHIEGWYMLQPEMGGAQTVTPAPVAYYEALPNEATEAEPVSFDAGGSYQYASLSTRTYVSDADLRYIWDFGDGEKGTGKVVEHAYLSAGTYASKLTVRNRRTKQKDTMKIPITVLPSTSVPPVLEKLPAEDEDGTFPLKWTYSGDTTTLKGFTVEESEDHRVLLLDDAEGNLEDKWEAAPGEGTRQPWQKSNSPTPKLRGNQRSSGESSYWTGGSPPSAPVGVDATQTMTLRQPIEISGEKPLLAYQSLFQMELDDIGRVEAAIEDGNPATELKWETIDSVTGSFEPDNPDHLSVGFSRRVANLARFSGRRILLRFTWVLGNSEGNRVQPAGWYVDDILVSSGEFNQIGQTEKGEFTVAGAPTGTNAYRVKALFVDGLMSDSSNVETIKVLRGGPSRRAGRGCAAAAGFEGVSATPAGRGVRFGFSRTADAGPVTVDILQMSRGRRVVRRPKRVARFRNLTAPVTWKGPVKGGRRAAAGYYVARFTTRTATGRNVRRVAVQLRRRGFRALRPFEIAPGCGLIAKLAADSPVFGGRGRVPLRVRYRLGADARVEARLMRGTRTVRRYRSVSRAAGRTFRLVAPARKLRRGDYTLRLTVRDGSTRASESVSVRRL